MPENTDYMIYVVAYSDDGAGKSTETKTITTGAGRLTTVLFDSLHFRKKFFFALGIFFLVDLRDFFFRFRVDGTKKNK